MDSVIVIPAFSDNFIYLYRYDDAHAVVIDPGTLAPVLEALKEHALTLTMALITHHHADHAGGATDLKRRTGCRIIGGDARRIAGIDLLVGGGDVVTAGCAQIEVIAAPGHTRTSLCYYVRPTGTAAGILWTGDTLFVAGCGRMFECDAGTMSGSLSVLACLPDPTLVYCGHDYAAENLRFALSFEPENAAVRDLLQKVAQTQNAAGHTVPSTIRREKLTNPFLRADSPEIRRSLNMPYATTVEVFAELRRRKDVF